MENEILHTLQEIRGLLYLITAALAVLVLSGLYFPSIIYKRMFQSALEKDWKENAIELYETGKFDELIKTCKSREKTHKYDSLVYYWQARVFLKDGDVEKTHDLFMYIKDIAPDWFGEYVEPYFYVNGKRNF